MNSNLAAVINATQMSGQANGSPTTPPEIQTNMAWMVLWVLSLTLVLFIPCCSNRHRRQLCFRRIRELRWIRDEGDPDDWHSQTIRRQQQQRRLQQEQQRQRFQISRTQEDEIREQFLLIQLQDYTKVRWL